MEIEDIIKKIEKKKKSVLKDLSTSDKITELITEKFQGAMDKLICDVLGLRKGWNAYEVMQWCPSRKENLPTLNYIKSELGVAKINEIVTQIFGDFKLELNQREKELMINGYKKVYKEVFRSEITKLAEEQGKEDAKKLFSETIGIAPEEV